MHNSEFISYIEAGQLYLFHSRGMRIFRDGTFWCPECGHRPLSPKHQKLLAGYIKNAKYENYQPEAYS
jgi:hypothetical protein